MIACNDWNATLISRTFEKLISYLGFEYFFWVPSEMFQFSPGKYGLSVRKGYESRLKVTPTQLAFINGYGGLQNCSGCQFHKKVLFCQKWFFILDFGFPLFGSQN